MLIECNPQAVLSVMGLLWSTASPESREAQAPALHRAEQLWVATEPANQGNNAENFETPVKNAAGKACCSGRSEAQDALVWA